jgi:hypothetical protein
MDTQVRSKLLAELTAERDDLNHRAAELERRAGTSQRDGESGRLEHEARALRESAREVNRRLDEVKDSDIHDDDRGGIER